MAEKESRWLRRNQDGDVETKNGIISSGSNDSHLGLWSKSFSLFFDFPIVF